MSDNTEQMAPTPMYPIMDGPSVPWEVMAPYEAMAQKNHSQTLKRLAERGGLSAAEAWAVVAAIKLSGLEVKSDWDRYKESWLKFAAETNARYERRERELAEYRGILDRVVNAFLGTLKCPAFDLPTGLPDSSPESEAKMRGILKVLVQEHCGLTKELATERAAREAAEARLAEAIGCFFAARAEGLIEALVSSDICRVRDIWDRRLALAEEALSSTTPPPILAEVERLRVVNKAAIEFAPIAEQLNAAYESTKAQLQIAREALEKLNTHNGSLSAIESRAEAATPGPWDCTHYDMETALISVHIGAEHICFVPVARAAEKPPNGQFMAHARQDVPALLSIIRNVQAALAQITGKEKK